MRIIRELRDGLTNLMTGAGTVADKRFHSAYALRHVDPAQIEAAYRASRSPTRSSRTSIRPPNWRFTTSSTRASSAPSSCR